MMIPSITVESPGELEKRNVPIPKSEQDSNIDEITETGDTSQLPPPHLESPNINPEAFTPAAINQGLTSSEHAFLDEEEKVMRLRERGMA